MLLLAWCGAAHAQTASPPRSELTQRGRFMASGQLGGFWSNDSGASFASYATWTLYAHPALTYFLRDNLGLGVALDAGWSKGDVPPQGEFENRQLGAALEFVWNVPLATRWSLMLRPAVGYAREWSDARTAFVLSDVGPFDDDYIQQLQLNTTLDYLRFSASLPFVYALTSQLGIGIGPDLRCDYVLTRERNAGSSSPPGSSLVQQQAALANNNHRGPRVQLGLSLTLLASF